MELLHVHLPAELEWDPEPNVTPGQSSNRPLPTKSTFTNLTHSSYIRLKQYTLSQRTLIQFSSFDFVVDWINPVGLSI